MRQVPEVTAGRTEAARAARSAKFVVEFRTCEKAEGEAKYSRGSPAFGLTSYRPAQAHNLLGQFSDLRHFQAKVCLRRDRHGGGGWEVSA